jgi:hypothetical protein
MMGMADVGAKEGVRGSRDREGEEKGRGNEENVREKDGQSRLRPVYSVQWTV